MFLSYGIDALFPSSLLVLIFASSRRYLLCAFLRPGYQIFQAVPFTPIQFPWLSLPNMYTSTTLHIISTSSTGTHLHFLSEISASVWEQVTKYSHPISMIKSPQYVLLHDPPHHFLFLYWYSSSLLVQDTCFENRLPNIPIHFPWLNLPNMYTSMTLHIISTSSPNGKFHFSSLLLINHFS